MISQTLAPSPINIDSSEARSMKSAYNLGKHVARQKVEYDSETQKILDKLIEKKVTINLNNVKKSLPV